MLLGVQAVIVESFERIHRSNLVGMGVLPLVFQPGTDRKSLGITGEEIIDITGLETITPRMELSLVIHRPNGTVDTVPVIAGSIRWMRWRTISTAASCSMCCGGWPRRPDHPTTRLSGAGRWGLYAAV